MPTNLISTAVRRAAVLGSPIAHSLSPVLHEAAYAELGLSSWSYGRVECAEAELAGFVSGLGPEWAGLSLTMPLKRAALAVATEVSAEAAAIGAANTLLLAPGVRRAENTDAPGMADALREAGLRAAASPLILGAGGTAQAALAALAVPSPEVPSLAVPSLAVPAPQVPALAGASPLVSGPVTVLVRSPQRAGELRTTAERLGLTLDVRPLEEAPARLAVADLVISTLPKGGADPFAHAALHPGAVVFDVVYDPWPTALAVSAAAAGCRVVSGLDLLLHQAGHQVRLMTGRAAPIEAMRAALAPVR